MKFAVTVAEFNPFHNGHKYLLDEMKRSEDAVVVVMSGNFTQRGEIAILDKYQRAKHAVLAGADAVIELPAIFAVSPAEIFASGAMGLINSIEGQKTLCFGAETADKEKFLKIAEILSAETQEFKKIMKEELKKGVSQAKARHSAVKSLYGDIFDDLLTSPNNLLGVEYTKAILKLGSDIEIYPVSREGDPFDQKQITSSLPSALAVRSAIADGRKKEIPNAVPPFVFADLPKRPPDIDEYILYSVLVSTNEQMRNIADCSEGLENRLKAYAKTCFSVDELKEKVKTKRYTYTRISRILLSNALKIEKDLVNKCLKYPPYLKVLAVNGEKKEILSYLCENSEIPLLTRKNDLSFLSPLAEKCLETDDLADDIYAHAIKKRLSDRQMTIVNKKIYDFL